MGENSAIAWTDHTFNFWIGCQKVSAGCDNCYAETLMDKRYHRVEWGQRKVDGIVASVGTRSLTSEANRRKPYSWQRKAAAFREQFGRRQRVFCSSLSDVFDNQVPIDWRADLWSTINATPDLDWLLLTKRPENILKLIPRNWQAALPRNIWIGVTAENQENYDRRMCLLADVRAAVHFVSYEPALGPLTISGLYPSWVICGGESGRGFRDMPEEWARSIKHECVRKGIPFFMKQMAGLREIPADLMLREFPAAA